MEVHKGTKTAINFPIIEDLAYLRKEKNKLISERNQSSKISEYCYQLPSDCKQQRTHWDLILKQIKRVAYDTHQDKKWKLSCISVFSDQAANKSKLIKIESLYRKLCNLYLAMSVNHEYSDIQLTQKSQMMKSALVSYIRSISSFDKLKESFSELKKSSEIIRNRIEEWNTSGESEVKNKIKKSLIKIFEKIENIIKIQEKTEERHSAARAELNGKQAASEFMEIENSLTSPRNVKLFRSGSNNKGLSKNKDDEEGVIYSSNSLNKIIFELNRLLEDNNNNEKEFKVKSHCNLTNPDAGYEDESESFLKSELFYDLDDKIALDKYKPIPVQEYASIFALSGNNFEAIENINPHIFLKDSMTNEEKKDVFATQFAKVFPKFFVNFNEKGAIEGERDNMTNIKIYNCKFEKMTILQKLVILWGLSVYGNSNVLVEIPNIFSFANSISYEMKEINNFISKQINELNRENKSKTISMDTSSTPIYNILRVDPPLLNNTNCNFYYNAKIYKLNNSTSVHVNMKKLFSLNNKEEQEALNKNECDMVFPKINFPSNQTSSIKLIKENNIFPSLSEKIVQRNEVKKFLIKVSEVLRKSSLTGKIEKFQTPYPVTPVSIKETNSEKKKSINFHHNNMDIDDDSLQPADMNSIASKILNQARGSTKSDIMEGVAFYSNTAISREWETLRSQWYQNNIQFKPKYRKYTCARSQALLNQQQQPPNPNNMNLGIPTNNPIMKNFNDQKAN